MPMLKRGRWGKLPAQEVPPQRDREKRDREKRQAGEDAQNRKDRYCSLSWIREQFRVNQERWNVGQPSVSSQLALPHQF